MVLGWIDRFGYGGLALAVFLESAGFPVPGETALLTAGFAAAHGALSLPWVVVVAASAGILGDNLGYALGARLGRPWIERHGSWLHLTSSRIDAAERFFGRHGGIAIALARFVPAVRVAAAVAAGVSRMPWRRFLVFNVLGATAWATIVACAAFGLGAALRRLLPHLSSKLVDGFTVVVVAVALITALWLHRAARITSKPDSAASNKAKV